MKSIADRLKIVGVFLLLAGCTAQYRDISGVAEFSQYVGQRYELKSDLDYSGVNAPPGYSDEINFYKISSRDPGWDGPEVVTRETLPKGSIFTITKIEECSNCLTFENPLRYALVTIHGQEPISLPIQINLNQIITGKHIAQIE